MKVNTDGVLLAAWLDLPETNTFDEFLDIGTGTGVIALILAQRAYSSASAISGKKFQITGIDIDSPSIEDAMYNFQRSKWSDILTSEAISLQEYVLKPGQKERFSLIVSNPPYFTNSFKSPQERRSTARHNDSLPLNVLIDEASYMLKENGVLALILPIGESMAVIDHAKKGALSLTRLCRVRPTPAKAEKRYMLEFRKTDSKRDNDHIDNTARPGISEEELVIQNTDGTYTEKYCNTISEYYYKDFRTKKLF